MTSPVVETVALERAFRNAMGNVAASVTVVTALGDDGHPHGTTVSAFNSLSMEPPMVMAALDNRSALLSRLSIGTIIGVNVLAAHQDQIALRFAQKRDDKFEDIGWEVLNGAPALNQRHAWVAGSVEQLVLAGDHTVVLATIHAAESGASAPLTYWQRTFGTHRSF